MAVLVSARKTGTYSSQYLNLHTYSINQKYFLPFAGLTRILAVAIVLAKEMFIIMVLMRDKLVEMEQ